MSTSPPQQVPSTSLDSQGVSVVTGNKSLDTQQAGQVYNPTTFATGVPVYFHPLGNGQFIGLYSRRWYGATVSSSSPDKFSGYSVDTNPNWVLFNATNGHTKPIGGQSGPNPPTNTAGTLTLTAGCSRATSYLYTLNTVVNGGVTTALVQHFHINNIDAVNLLAEETIPTITVGDSPVVFDRGFQVVTPYIIYAGVRASDNALFFARKGWAAVGNSSRRLSANLGTMENTTFWTYQTARGWSSDPTQAAPLVSPRGVLTTSGPVSFASYRDRTWMSTVQVDGGAVSAQVYASKGLYDPWTPVGSPVALGTMGSTYLGSGLQFQSILYPNSTNPIVTSGANVTAIPIVHCTKETGGGYDRINMVWDLFPVPRQS